MKNSPVSVEINVSTAKALPAIMREVNRELLIEERKLKKQHPVTGKAVRSKLNTIRQANGQATFVYLLDIVTKYES